MVVCATVLLGGVVDGLAVYCQLWLLVNWVNSCCLVIAGLRLRNRSLSTGWYVFFNFLFCFVFGWCCLLFVL